MTNGYFSSNQSHLIDNQEQNFVPNTSYMYSQQEIYPYNYSENTLIHENERYSYSTHHQSNINQMISSVSYEKQELTSDNSNSNVNSLINDNPELVTNTNKEESNNMAHKNVPDNSKEDNKKKKKSKKSSTAKKDSVLDERSDENN
jgi:hypothetical protein